MKSKTTHECLIFNWQKHRNVTKDAFFIIDRQVTELVYYCRYNAVNMCVCVSKNEHTEKINEQES